MKLSTFASIGSFAALASASAAPDYWASLMCTDKTITQTVTVTAGALAPTQWVGKDSYDGKDGDYGTKTTSTPCPVASTSSAPAAKKTIRVEVDGVKNGAAQLIFNPNQVDARLGDQIDFFFLARNHTLAQSSFDKPCTSNGAFDTGFNQFNPQNIDGKFVVPFTVSTDKPLWFYCRQGGPPNHCGKGMVFGINPTGKMDKFIQNAIAQNGGSATSTATSTPTAAYAASTETKAPYKVTVGLDNGKTLLFDPPFLNEVKRGEKIIFDFRAKNHTLTESSFDKPCTKLNANAFDTNFMNVNLEDTPDAKATTFTVDTDRPRYVYCRQANGTPSGHCGKGMVFGLNIDQYRFNEFQMKAEATLPKIKGRSIFRA